MLLAILAGACGAPPAVAGKPRSKPTPYLGPSNEASSWMRSLPRAKSVVWAVGDAADGGAHGHAVAAMIAAQRVDRFLYLGDVYNTGTAAEFATNYAPVFGRFDRIAAPTIGNHEWANSATGYVPYWTAARGSPPPAWYATAASGWQLISLDSNTSTDEGSAQLEWLRRKLARSPRFGSCRLAFMHAAPFNAGTHHGEDPELEPIVAALTGRARIVLSGHEHNMQRLVPIRGITQLVSGAAHTRFYPVDHGDPRLAFANHTRPGALRIKLGPGRALLSFVAADGSVLDRSSVRCNQNLRR